jgi:type II secretory pathway component PulM
MTGLSFNATVVTWLDKSLQNQRIQVADEEISSTLSG